jgi:CHASE3 domain sensor protein
MKDLVHSEIVGFKPEFFYKKLRFLFDKKQHADDYVNPSEFKKVLLRSTIIPFVFVILISGVFLIQSKKIFDENAKVRKADMFLAKAERSLKLIIDSETALRGFLLTANEAYLEPWNNAVVEYPRTLDELIKLEEGSSLQVTRLNRIAHLYESWLSSARYVIDKKRRHPEILGEQIVLRKEIMDEIRLRYNQLSILSNKAGMPTGKKQKVQ